MREEDLLFIKRLRQNQYVAFGARDHRYGNKRAKLQPIIKDAWLESKEKDTVSNLLLQLLFF